MKIFAVMLLIVNAAWGQYAPSASGSTTAAGEINGKPNWQLSAGNCASLSGTAGKDLCYDTTNHVWYHYSTGAWAQIVDVSGSFSNPTWITALAYSKITGVPAFARTDTGNTWTTGVQDMSAATNFRAPNVAGYAPTINGHFGFDTTALEYKGYVGASAKIFALFSGSFSDNDCLKYNAALNMIITFGSSCGGGGGSGTVSPGTTHGVAIYSASTTVISTGIGSTDKPLVGVTGADPAFSKLTLTNPATAATLTIADNKTVTVNNTMTLAGADSTTMTFPATSATIARTDAANTFIGHQTIEGVASTGATGTGKFVFDGTPTLVTPVIGVATATSINKVAITPPASSATITVPDGVTMTGPASSGTVATLGNTETFSGNKTFTGTVDAGGATHTQPAKKGIASAIPGTCTQGEEYFATDATAGQNMYYCTATNTWTQQLNSGGGGSNSNTYTTVSFSATPTFTMAANTLGQTWLLTLTGSPGNVTSSTLNSTSAIVGEIGTFRLCQDGTGNHTFVPPTNVLNMGTISPTLNTCSNQTFIWDGTNLQAVGVMIVTGGTGSSITMPGSSSGSVVITPAAAAGGTVTIPNVTGNFVTTGDTGTIVSLMLAANVVTSAKLAVVNTRRTICMPFGSKNAAAVLQNTDLADNAQYFINAPVTVVEVTVRGDADVPSILLGRDRAGTVLNLTSSNLATAASGGVACSNTGGTTGLNGTTTCSGTLQNTALNAGDWIVPVSGVAGGTAKQMTACVTWTVN